MPDAEGAPKPSDQLPDEAPAEQVPDDVPEADEGAAREAARRHAEQEAGQSSDRGYRDSDEQRAHEQAAREEQEAS